MRRLPEVWGDRPVHLDPDLDCDTPTYGDNCRTAGRAYSLRRAEPGDTIFFVARLHPRSGGASRLESPDAGSGYARGGGFRGG